VVGQQQAKGGLKRNNVMKRDDFSDFEDDNPFEKMLDLPNVCGHTPFFVSVVKNHLQMAEMLLKEHMSSVNCSDQQDDSPLHWAVILENMTMVQFLLEHNASVLHRNYHQNTPLMVAAINRKYEIVKLLLTSFRPDSAEFQLTLLQQQQ
jgi:ankyrin repeat protein